MANKLHDSTLGGLSAAIGHSDNWGVAVVRDAFRTAWPIIQNPLEHSILRSETSWKRTIAL
jgi:hypothetical protein